MEQLEQLKPSTSRGVEGNYASSTLDVVTERDRLGSKTPTQRVVTKEESLKTNTVLSMEARENKSKGSYIQINFLSVSKR